MDITVSEALKICKKLETFIKSGDIWDEVSQISNGMDSFIVTAATTKEKFEKECSSAALNAAMNKGYDKFTTAMVYLHSLKAIIITTNHDNGNDLNMAQKNINQMQCQQLERILTTIRRGKYSETVLSYEEYMAQLEKDSVSFVRVNKNHYSEEMDTKITKRIKEIKKSINELDEEITRLNHTTEISISDDIREFVDEI